MVARPSKRDFSLSAKRKQCASTIALSLLHLTKGDKAEDNLGQVAPLPADCSIGRFVSPVAFAFCRFYVKPLSQGSNRHFKSRSALFGNVNDGLRLATHFQAAQHDGGTPCWFMSQGGPRPSGRSSQHGTIDWPRVVA
jgi:hypothetical protein